MRVLFLTHRLPYAPNKGDRLRAYYMLRALAARMPVDLVSLVHDDEEEARADDLRSVAASVTIARVPRLLNLARSLPALTTSRPLTHILLDSPRMKPLLTRLIARTPPDVVLAFCSSMARFALQPPLAGRPLVIDMVDVDSEKWAALAERGHAPKRWILRREARQLACFEAAATRRAGATLVVNERERAALERIAPGQKICVIPAGIDVEGLRPAGPPTEEPCVVFCGVMNYAPNEQAVEWFVRSVWNDVKARSPAARLLIVGSDPTNRVRALGMHDASITVTGRVPDVRPYLWQAAVSIAPIATSHGVQTKVLEAVAAGLPCVVTSAVFEGLPSEARAACTVADRPDVFASQILALLAKPGRDRRAIALDSGIGRLDCISVFAELPAILEAAIRAHATEGRAAARI